MDNLGNMSVKTQILATIYKNINDEGRNNLDFIVQKLSEFNRNLEKDLKIGDFSFLFDNNPLTHNDILSFKKINRSKI